MAELAARRSIHFPPELLYELSLPQPCTPFRARPTTEPTYFFYSPLVSSDDNGRIVFSPPPTHEIDVQGFYNLLSPHTPAEMLQQLGPVVELVFARAGAAMLSVYGFVRCLEVQEQQLIDSPLLPMARIVLYFLLDGYALDNIERIVRVLAHVPSPRALLERRETRYFTLAHIYDALAGGPNLIQYLVDGTLLRDVTLRDEHATAWLASRMPEGVPILKVIERASQYHHEWVVNDRLPQLVDDPIDQALGAVGFIERSQALDRPATRQAVADMSRVNQLIALLISGNETYDTMLTPGDPQSLELALQPRQVVLVMNAGGLADDTVFLPYLAHSSNVFTSLTGDVVRCEAESARKETVIRNCHMRTLHGLSELLRGIFTMGDSGVSLAPTTQFERIVFEVDPLYQSRTTMFLASHRMFTVMLRPTLGTLGLPRQLVACAASVTLGFDASAKTMDQVIAELVVMSRDGHGPFTILPDHLPIPWPLTNATTCPLAARLRRGRTNEEVLITEENARKHGAALIYMASQCTDGKVALAFTDAFIRGMMDRALSLCSSNV